MIQQDNLDQRSGVRQQHAFLLPEQYMQAQPTALIDGAVYMIRGVDGALHPTIYLNHVKPMFLTDDTVGMCPFTEIYY